MTPKLNEHIQLFIQVARELSDGLYNAMTITWFGIERGIVTGIDKADLDEKKRWLCVNCGRIATRFGFPPQGDGRVSLSFATIPMAGHHSDRWQAVAGVLSGDLGSLVLIAVDRYIDTGTFVTNTYGIPCPECGKALEILELMPGACTTATIKCHGCGAIHAPVVHVTGDRLKRLTGKNDPRESPDMEDMVRILDLVTRSLSDEELQNTSILVAQASAMQLLADYRRPEEARQFLTLFFQALIKICDLPKQGDGLIEVPGQAPAIGYHPQRWRAFIESYQGKIHGSVCHAVDRYIDDGVIVSELFFGSCVKCAAGLAVQELVPGPTTTVTAQCKNCPAVYYEEVEITGNRLERLLAKEEMHDSAQ